MIVINFKVSMKGLNIDDTEFSSNKLCYKPTPKSLILNQDDDTETADSLGFHSDTILLH